MTALRTFNVYCDERCHLGRVDKFDRVTRGGNVEHAKEAVGELVISCGDGAVDLEGSDHPLDAMALAIEPLAVVDGGNAVGFRRDDGFDPALLQVGADRIDVVSLVGEKSIWRLLRKIDQRLVTPAVRRLARNTALTRPSITALTAGVGRGSGSISSRL